MPVTAHPRPVLEELEPRILYSADLAAMAATLKATLAEELAQLSTVPVERLLEQRYARLRSYGAFRAD